jgi:hypothetical protein
MGSKSILPDQFIKFTYFSEASSTHQIVTILDKDFDLILDAS